MPRCVRTLTLKQQSVIDLPAMSPMVDSVASCKARVTALGLESVWAKLEEFGSTTYASFAFFQVRMFLAALTKACPSRKS